MRSLPRILLTVLVLALCGCVILPVPIPPSGTSGREVASALEVGVTGRSEVHERFGSPRLTIGAHRELFDLQVDPFHFWILAAVGGPGYASGDAFRTGGEQRYSLAVAYDEADRIAAWRVLLPRTGVSNGSDGRLLPTPARPTPLQRWTGDQVRFLADGTAVLLKAGRQGALDLTMIDGRTGTTLRTLAGADEGCGNLTSAGMGRAFPVFGIGSGEVVTVPRRIDAASVPCRWTVDAAGHLVASRIEALVVPEATLEARIAGDVMLREQPGGGIDILSFANEALGRLPAPWPPRAAAADAEAGRVLVQTEADAPGPFWLLDRARGRAAVVPDLAAPAAARCHERRFALSPEGDTLALHCGTHVEIWALPRGDGAAELQEILPLPQDVSGPDLAFSSDGRHLALGPRGIVVWRTVDWSIEAFLSGDDMEPEETALRIALNADATRLATRTGLWQLPGDAMAAQSARP